MHLEEKRYNLNDNKKKVIFKDLNMFLAGIPEIRFAYIHGSFLDTVAFRDIDVAIYFDDSVPVQKQVDLSLELSAELSHKFSLPVDVHALNQASPGFCYEVTKGLVVASKDEEERLEFVENTWRIYFDFKPILIQSLQDLLAE